MCPCVVVQLPIAFLLVFVIGAFFQQQTDSPGNQAFGLMCAIIGLMFFMVEHLCVCGGGGGRGGAAHGGRTQQQQHTE